MHKMISLNAPTTSEPVLKSILAGILKKENGLPLRKDPTPDLLIKVYNVVNFAKPEEFLTWLASLLMYHSLLSVTCSCLTSYSS